MKLNVPAYLIRFAQTCVAKGDIRYYLNGILFASNGNIVATDGATLAKTSIAIGPLENTIVKLDGVVPKAALDCHIDTDAGTCICIGKRGKTLKILAAEVIDGTFPEYQRVIPATTTQAPTTTIGFNPKLLARAEVMGPSVAFTFHGDNGSAIARPTSGTWPDNTLMVIMPTRL